MSFLSRIFGGADDGSGNGTEGPLSDGELDRWAIVTADNQDTGETVIFRIRNARPASSREPSFSNAISIRWSFETDSGMPSVEVTEAMTSFEDAIDRLTGSNGLSELMYVATGRGKREWLFYASDQDRFMAEFNGLLAGHPAYPLGIEFYDDPEWTVWAEVAEAAAVRTGSQGD